MTPRSYLYVPADQPDKLAKALGRGADALIVDLEDAVAPPAKAAARAAVAEWLSGLEPAGVEVWVRVNPGATGHADVAAVAGPMLSGVVAAKTETARDLIALDRALRDAETTAGLPDRGLAVVPLLESAAAVLGAQTIATAPRVRRLQIGEADLCGETGIAPGDDERELLYARSHLVLVSAAAGLDAPYAPVSPNFRDTGRFRASTRALARMGFVGRACIHPAQVEVANEVFTPDADAVARARALVERFEQAVATGDGVLVDDAGHMVDEALVRQARLLLQRVR